MYEIEVKVRTAHAPVMEALDQEGAEEREVIEQVDRYFDPPHRDFAETDEALRIRIERPVESSSGSGVEAVDAFSGSGELAYKGPLVESASKTREEVETAIEEVGAVVTILERLGYEEVHSVEKVRRVYELDGFVLSLDSVAGLGEFVEIEASGEEAEIERLREGAYEVLGALGIDPDTQIRTSYLGLLLDSEEA